MFLSDLGILGYVTVQIWGSSGYGSDCRFGDFGLRVRRMVLFSIGILGVTGVKRRIWGFGGFRVISPLGMTWLFIKLFGIFFM